MINTILEIILRVIFIYFVVLIGIRLTGKREIGQMAPFDFVLLLLIANSVQNAMTGPDTSLAGGTAAAITLLAVNAFVARVIMKNSKVRDLIEGTPTVLIQDGKIIKQNLLKEGISVELLEQSLREHGTHNISEVKLAVLEIDGAVSVVRHDDMPTTPRSHHRFRVFQKK